MTQTDDPLAARLPLRRKELLRAAIGTTLLDIERWFSTTVADFVARGGDETSYFARCSGATQLTFSSGLVHALSVWPSELSIVVDEAPFGEDPYSDRHRLSQTRAAPVWLRDCLGSTVRDVRVYVYRDDVPSNEARQAAVSYVLDASIELFYCTYLHGHMDSDELLRGEDVPRDQVAGWGSIGSSHDASSS
jgi:hypothetical protein